MGSLLKTLLDEFSVKIKEIDGIERSTFFPEISNKILVAIGMRRSGKTHFLLHYISTLLKKISISRILYLNFEDERLLPASQKTLSSLLESFYTLYPENHEHLCYLFLDEIQNVEGWPLVIRRFFDSKKVKIFLSGSSAKLLSKEIHTSLRGRSFSIEIWPFNFHEYLKAKNYTEKPNNILGKKELDKLNQRLQEYLKEGGFPETTILNFEDRNQVLQDYVSVVIMRDIIERHKITNIALIKYLVKLLIKNSSSPFTINKCYQDLKSQGFQVSKMTIHEYLDYMEDAFLVFQLPLYSESIRKVQTNPKKIYAVDTGLARAYTLGMNQNIGHHFENLIYLDLRRKGHTIYYYLTTSRKEVDFLTCDKKGRWHLYQVVWNTYDPKTRQREEEALQEAEKELGIRGELITPELYLTKFCIDE